MDDPGVVLARHKLDVDDYHRMGEAGILAETDRVELIDGELIDMAPIGQGHVAVVNRITEAFVLACAGRAIVSAQNPNRLDRMNEPQPDLAVLRRRSDFYANGAPPGPADVLLLVEVADSSLRFDRTVKVPLYAQAGIGEVWVVDLQRRVLEVYRVPGGVEYSETAIYRAGDTVPLALAPEIRIAVQSIFG